MVNKVKMCSEKQRYTVQAFDERFAVCTKPFNARKTYLYFVADMKTGLRGPSNWPYGFPFNEPVNTPIGGQKLLTMFKSGEATHSRRSRPMKMTEAEISQLKAIQVGAGIKKDQPNDQ